MATLTIRDLDDALKLKLRLRAASQNRSMEEEARQILRVALLQPAPATGTLVARVRKRFDGLGDVQLAIEPREAIREPLEIHEPAANYSTAAATPASRSAARSAGRKVGKPRNA
jgi:plasmid stability protein